MWKNFMTAIGLLAIAMMAALYSSGAARSGRGMSAAIAAVAALAVALWVGIRFVPRLASRVDWEWLPLVSHYHVTREGWIYFAAVAVVAFAAVNTANNLLYIVLSALLAVIVLSAFLSALNFRFLRIAVRIPSHCYAGEPFPMTIQVRNEKRLFPSFSIQFEPTWSSAFRFSTLYVPIIHAQEQVSKTQQAMLPKRGRFKLQHLKSSSRYPFGFFVKDRKNPADGECICYPEILPQDQMNFASMDLQGSNHRFERGLGHDLYTIRDYVPSDGARHVHWKASAKSSTLKTREYAAEEGRRVNVAMDRFGYPEDDEDFERQVSFAASLVYHLANEGVEVRLTTDEWHGSGLEPILEYLALVERSSSAELPPVGDEAITLSLRT